MVYGELGRTSLNSRRGVNVIRYLLNIVQLDNTKFARKMYSLMYRTLDNNPTHMSWARNVKTPLQSTGLYEAWVNQGVGNVNVFISLVKQRVFYMFGQNWNTDINNSTRARCYTLYADFRLQSYLILINIEKVRVALSRFRVSAHRREVENGRWHKPVAVPLNERKCRTCLHCLEDEFHFLLKCPLYHELRKNKLNRIIEKY